MTSIRLRDEDTRTAVGRVSEREILQELDRILESQEFKASPRRREMLRYLVGETVAGRAHLLRGTR